MTLKKHTLRIIITAIILISVLTSMILFVPPVNILIIGLMILLTAVTVYVCCRIAVQKTYALLAATGTGTLLTVSYLAGFNFLNTILLLSFIIGIGILLKKE